MQWDRPWKDRLSERRTVEVNGRPVFDVHFVERNSRTRPIHPIDGVPDILAIEHYATALGDAYQQLTSEAFGWSGWRVTHPESPETRDVLVFDLGPNYLGAALDAIGSPPYLVLNSRTLELPGSIEQKRRAVVAHELVHLLQFQTVTYQYWPARRGRAGEDRDPNWWLHEATALALEHLLSRGSSVSDPLFWTWATNPECSLDSDPGGTLAAPFLLYLSRRFGADLLADIYAATEDQVPGMRGVSLLAQASGNRGLTLASAESEDCFASGYCVDAAFLGESDTVLPIEWADTIGQRAITDCFTSYPVTHSDVGYRVDHLACRYFEFIPTETSRSLHVEIRTELPGAINVLRGELVSVKHDGTRLQSTMTNAEPGRLSGSIDFCMSRISRVVLVVANCACEPGFADFDQLQFVLGASTD